MRALLPLAVIPTWRLIHNSDALSRQTTTPHRDRRLQSWRSRCQRQTWRPKGTPSRMRATKLGDRNSRGGGRLPGAPYQHRFWTDELPPTQIDTCQRKLHRAMQILRISHLYNPPGDGLCFWSALANGLQPGKDTHLDRTTAALNTQRAVIKHVKDPNLPQMLKTQYFTIFTQGLDHGIAPTAAEYNRQLEIITEHPQLYHLPINDVLRQAAAHALSCTIEWWCVYNPLTPAVNAHCESHGSGAPIRLLYDSSAAHYMHIVHTHADSPCTQTEHQKGTEEYTHMAAECVPEHIDTLEQAAVSWQLERTHNIKWIENVWHTQTDQYITVTRQQMIGVDEHGWQLYDNTDTTITVSEASQLLTRKLKPYKLASSSPALQPTQDAPGPPVSQYPASYPSAKQHGQQSAETNEIEQPAHPANSTAPHKPKFVVKVQSATPTTKRPHTKPKKETSRPRPTDASPSQIRQALSERTIEAHLDNDIKLHLQQMYAQQQNCPAAAAPQDLQPKQTQRQKRRERQRKLEIARHLRTQQAHSNASSIPKDQQWEEGSNEVWKDNKAHITEGLARQDIADVLAETQTIDPHSTLHISMNMRSSQEMFKIYHLIHCLRDVPDSVDIVLTLQETWLQSTAARQRLRYPILGEGWRAAALDRSEPGESRSGGIITLVRPGNRGPTSTLHLQHVIVDLLGIQETTMYRTQTGDT